jgi:hypothetical protein
VFGRQGVVVASRAPVTRLTARGGQIVSETGAVVATMERVGRARQRMRVSIGPSVYRSRGFWHPHTLLDAANGRTVVTFKRSWFSMRFRLLFSNGASLRSSNSGGRLSLIDNGEVVIEAFRGGEAPPPTVRDQRPGDIRFIHVVVYREVVPDLVLAMALAVKFAGETFLPPP